MNWLAQNWVWVLIGVAVAWFLLRGGGHSRGHGGGFGGLLGGSGGHGGASAVCLAAWAGTAAASADMAITAVTTSGRRARQRQTCRRRPSTP